MLGGGLLAEWLDSTRTFAFARIWGGMILSGPNACRGSTKEAKTLPHFLHSPSTVLAKSSSGHAVMLLLTSHRRGQWIVKSEGWHDELKTDAMSDDW